MLRQLILSKAVQRSANLLVQSGRSISRTPVRLDLKHGHTPNNLEKRFLVWGGKYKSISEIPPHVSYEVMERVRNKVRIRVANIMMLFTVLGCCIMVYSGKQAAKSGDSVTKQNIDWHKKYNEDHQKADAK